MVITLTLVPGNRDLSREARAKWEAPHEGVGRSGGDGASDLEPFQAILEAFRMLSGNLVAQ